jgi:hypothetical protein
MVIIQMCTRVYITRASAGAGCALMLMMLTCICEEDKDGSVTMFEVNVGHTYYLCICVREEEVDGLANCRNAKVFFNDGDGAAVYGDNGVIASLLVL